MRMLSSARLPLPVGGGGEAAVVAEGVARRFKEAGGGGEIFVEGEVANDDRDGRAVKEYMVLDSLAEMAKRLALLIVRL